MSNPTQHLVVGPDEPGNVQLGMILHNLRDRAKLSRAEAAQKHEVTSEYLRLIELGKRIPALGTMGTMLIVYNIDHHISGNVIVFETFTVEFTSRIRKTRHKFPDKARHKIPDNEPIERRDEAIGQIVRLLVTTDDTTLRQIRTQLLRTRKTPRF